MHAPEATIFIAILITSIVLGVVLTYFVVTITLQHRRTRKLYQSKILAEITTLEKERSRVAADLHDELGPLLLAVKYKINSFDVSDTEDKAVLNAANKNIDQAIDRIRGISNDLLPEVLLRKGLVPAMQQVIDGMQKDIPFVILFSATRVPELPTERSVHIYRMLQEVIHNTAKHANATELKVKVYSQAERLMIQTHDNGSGFDYLSQTKEFSGLGLRNLQSRVEILGGHMYLESSSEKGTQYIFDLPL